MKSKCEVLVYSMRVTELRNFPLFCFLLLIGALAGVPLSAQEFDFKELPVIDPKPDFNGVDATHGSFYTGSPLTFATPGSSHLNIQHLFNGRTESFSLNVYLDDSTYLPSSYNSDPEAQRNIRIHVGGTDKLFSCGLVGDCQQNVRRDGSKLTRVAARGYIFTDKQGAEYRFFPLATYPVDSSCADSYENGCNMAGYQAYAYVSTILYPTGEKLTYNSFSSVKTVGGQKYVVDSIQSNLGYRMELESTVSTSFTPQTTAGWNWFRYRHIGPDALSGWSQVKFSLYLGAERIDTLTVDRNWSTTDLKALVIKHSDDLGRVYEINFHGGLVEKCAPAGEPTYDLTVLLPLRQVSPGGVETQIQYHMDNAATWEFKEAAGVGESIPVYRITRGGKIWEYDNLADRKTLKDPESKTRNVEFSWIYSEWDAGPVTECPPAGIDTIITSYEDGLYRRSEYEYQGSVANPQGNLLNLAKLPEGNGYDYDYDSRGNLTVITQLAKPGSGQADKVVFRAEYPAICSNPKMCNKPMWVEDAKALRTDYTYSATHGGVLTVTQPAQPNGVRPQTRFSYSDINTSDGIVWRNTGISLCASGASCQGTANELKTTTTYWGSTFLPETKTRMAGDGSLSTTESFVYNSAGLLTQSTDSMGQTTYYFYDAVGRKIGEITPDPDGLGPLPRLATRTTYNNDDKPTRIQMGVTSGTDLAALNAMSVTTYVDSTYDNIGRKIQDKTVASGTIYSVAQYSYDAWNRIICTAQRMNLSSLPTDACALGSQGLNGYDRITKNEYDDAGQLVKVYRAYGTALEQTYARYEYSDNSKRTAVIDANDNKARLVYDGHDRQTHWYFPSKTKGSLSDSTTDYEQYGYDLNSNRTSYRRRDGVTVTYQYDNLNRMMHKTVPERTALVPSHTEDVFYSYDNRGLTLHTRFGSQTGQGITHTYDALGRTKNSTINMDGVSRQLTYAYNAKDIRTHVTHPDNESFIYNHNHLGRLTTINHGTAGNLATYIFDARGRLDILAGGGASDYGYDGIGRVTSLLHDFAGATDDNTYSYLYNPVSQVTKLTASNSNFAPINGQQSRNYVVNGLNQYTDISGAVHSYDANGNLISDGQTNYTYDQENRLVKAVTLSGALKAELWYDPMGRLYKVQGLSGTTHFLYDGDELVAEYNSTSTTVNNRYVHGKSVDDPVAWFQGPSLTTSNRRHLRANHQGSIVAVSDGAGSKLFLPRYDNWGKPQSTQPVRFGYTGQIWISELGLWHYKARMYSPTLGRFLQTDPIGYEDQMNLYAYVGNDPVNKIDPTGMRTCECLWVRTTQDIARRGIAGMQRAANMIAEAVNDGAESGSVTTVPDFTDVEGNKTPPIGEPGSTVRGGTGSRTYGEDGYPLRDRDLPHPDEKGIGNDDHVHDWGRPEDGSRPTKEHRGNSRPPRAGDPPAPRGPNVPPATRDPMPLGPQLPPQITKKPY